MSCNCVPNTLYIGGQPTWNPQNASNPCVPAMLGLQPSSECYSDCREIPIPCYGYALNLVTPVPWTYPGLRQYPHGTTLPPIRTCEDLIKLTTSDGSTFLGKSTLPNTVAPSHHVFAAYVGKGNGNYHYIRKDVDSPFWSSKNGPDMPTQKDSRGNKVIDPSTAYFELEGVPLDFCGYFSTSPKEVCPSPSDCVRGEYGRRVSGPWPGCGKVPPF